MPPIKPEEALVAKREAIPEVVFEVFNRLILENIRGSGRATFRQSKVVRALQDAGVDSEEAFAKGWLDVEPVYRDAGWEVVYDNPAYNETSAPTFTFKQARIAR